ncbi:MAG: hypothetical protein ABI083_15215 [Lapillicoccus sp.]
MSTRTATRPLVLAVLIAAAWFIAAATSASAMVAPEPPAYQVPAEVLAPAAAAEGLPLLQYVFVAVVACLVTLAATLAVQAMLRHTNSQHAVASA